MLDQNEGHASVVRQMSQQLGERFQAASRRANADNGKKMFYGLLHVRRCGLLHRA